MMIIMKITPCMPAALRTARAIDPEPAQCSHHSEEQVAQIA
jgi:hypothetical protein